MVITSGNIECIIRGRGVDDGSENIYLTQCYEIALGINWLAISLGDIAFPNQNSKTSQITGQQIADDEIYIQRLNIFMVKARQLTYENILLKKNQIVTFLIGHV